MKFNDNTNWKWFGEKSLMHQRVHLYNVGETPSGKIKNRRFTTVDEITQEPGTVVMTEDAVTLSLEYDEAEQIMQQLWDMGFRPHGIESSSEYVQSLKDHIRSLKDHIDHLQTMQTLQAHPAQYIGHAKVDTAELLQKAAKAEQSLPNSG